MSHRSYQGGPFHKINTQLLKVDCFDETQVHVPMMVLSALSERRMPTEALGGLFNFLKLLNKPEKLLAISFVIYPVQLTTALNAVTADSNVRAYQQHANDRGIDYAEN